VHTAYLQALEVHTQGELQSRFSHVLSTLTVSCHTQVMYWNNNRHCGLHACASTWSPVLAVTPSNKLVRPIQDYKHAHSVSTCIQLCGVMYGAVAYVDRWRWWRWR
jgi:hypothetical protein